MPISWVLVNPWGLVGRHEIRLLVTWFAVALGLRSLSRCRDVLVPSWWREALVGLGVLVASVLVNRDWWTTIIGHADRHLGLIGYVMLAMAAWIGVNLDERGRQLFRRGVELAGAVVAIGAIGQLVAPAVFGEAGAGGRPTSTFGSAAYSGAAIAVSLVFWVDRALSSAEPRVRSVSIVGSTIVGLGLVLTGSRGAWIGGAVGIALLVWRHWSDHRRRVNRLLVAVAGVALLSIATSSTVRDRLDSLASPNSGTAGGRLVLWRAGVRAILERPLLGWGPDRTRVGLPPSLPRSFEATYWDETIPDRVHNAWLDIAVVLGVPFALLLVWLSVRCVAAVLSTEQGSERRLWGIAAAAHAPHLAFNFVQIDVDMVVAVILGVAIGGSIVVVQPRSIVRTVWSVSATSIALVSVIFGLSLTMADTIAGRGLRAEERGDLEAARSAYEAALSLSLDDARYAEVLARFERRAAGPLAAVDAADRAAGRHADDPFYAELPALVRAEASQEDPAFAPPAIARYEELIGRWPNHAAYHTGLGIALAANGDATAAAASLRTAIELAPRSDEPYVNLAILLIAQDRSEDAAKVLGAGLATVDDTSVLRSLRDQLG